MNMTYTCLKLCRGKDNVNRTNKDLLTLGYLSKVQELLAVIVRG